MPIFLSSDEYAAIRAHRHEPEMAAFLRVLEGRCAGRAASPGLLDRRTDVDWWHCAAEYVTDAAMLYAIGGDESLGGWLRDVVTSIARRPLDDWQGPAFRRRLEPPRGHLETAHLSFCTAIALDLAGDLFTETEKQEVEAALRERGIPLCLRWTETDRRLFNQRCVLVAGVAVAAAVLDDQERLAWSEEQFGLCADAFQPDGSYGESLQYSSYAMYGLMLTYESLVRARPALAASLPIERYALSMRWHAASLLYMKPLSGWGAHPQPRAANFNDSAALFAPSTDVLCHIAARCRERLPTEAGLAAWIRETYCPPVPKAEATDRHSFGFRNTFGFLTPVLLPATARAIAPREAGLTELETFTNGNALARDAWEGRTILATQGGSEPLHCTGHLHADHGSFILAHNRERLLADPGHSCYRSLIHPIESSAPSHNTATFRVRGGEQVGELTQRRRFAVREVIDGRRLSQKVERGDRRLLAAARDDVRIVGAELSAAYGAPLREFARFWLLCGSHVLFVVDRIVASDPVVTTWHWLLNNRDGLLEDQVVGLDRLVARRGMAGIQLLSDRHAAFARRIHGWIHDCYHPLPGRPGEGANGTGVIVRFKEPEARRDRTAVHAVAVDDFGLIGGWSLTREHDGEVVGNRDGSIRWALSHDADGIHLEERVAARRYDLVEGPDGWRLA